MKYLLRRESGLTGAIGYSSEPIGYADTENECWEYALNEFKGTDFARYPFWRPGQLPLGYKVYEIGENELKKAHWLKRLK